MPFHRLRRSLRERTGRTALTLMRQTPWSQGRLFTAHAGRAAERFRVSDGTTWGPATTSLALAVAQARAVAVAGGRALIFADDGTAAVVTHGADGFVIATTDEARWPTTVRRVLSRHG